MSDMIKWGILGTGRISRAFAEGLKYTPNGVLHGVASRNHGRSKTYAEEWKVPLAFENYQQMAESEAIDAVYVATPHTQHAENSILCMNNGKAVLCEKPFAVNHEQAKEMVTHAHAKTTFAHGRNVVEVSSIDGSIAKNDLFRRNR